MINQLKYYILKLLTKCLSSDGSGPFENIVLKNQPQSYRRLALRRRLSSLTSRFMSQLESPK